MARAREPRLYAQLPCVLCNTPPHGSYSQSFFTTITQVFSVAFNVNLGQRAWVAILILPMVVLSWIRNLDELSAFSMVANVCIVASLLIILYAEINSLL